MISRRTTTPARWAVRLSYAHPSPRVEERLFISRQSALRFWRRNPGYPGFSCSRPHAAAPATEIAA